MSWLGDALAAQPTLDTVAKQQVLLPTSKAFSVLPDNKVLRVFQLDALTAQEDISEMLRAALFQIFNILPFQTFRFAYQEELVLALDAVLYRLSTWRWAQSVGDRMQNLVLRDEVRAADLGLRSSVSLIPSLVPNRRLLMVHAVLSILAPYLSRKLQRRMLEENWEREEAGTARHRAANVFKWSFISWSVLSLLNTLHFLATGQYRTLLGRLLSLKLVYGSQRMVRVTNLMYFNQHMWWATWTSLLSVLNVGRYFRRMLNSARHFASTESAALVGKGSRVCCACKQTPTLAQRSNCGHTYCYYCIKSRLLDCESSGSFRCYRCGQSIHECSPS